MPNDEVEFDSYGRRREWNKGDRVFVPCVGMDATVIRQRLSYDGIETFWGNVELEYDDGVKGVANSWQLVNKE